MSILSDNFAEQTTLSLDTLLTLGKRKVWDYITFREIKGIQEWLAKTPIDFLYNPNDYKDEIDQLLKLSDVLQGDSSRIIKSISLSGIPAYKAIQINVHVDYVTGDPASDLVILLQAHDNYPIVMKSIKEGVRRRVMNRIK